MGPGLLGQRPILAGDGLMHPRDLVLDPGDRLGRVRHQLPEARRDLAAPWMDLEAAGGAVTLWPDT